MDAIKAETEKLKQEAGDWKNKYYMAYADLQNLRKNLEEEQREAIRYRASGFLDKLLPALDSFYFALKFDPQGDEAKKYQQGFVYIYKQISQGLADEGVSEVEPKVGDDFDPSSMHALEALVGGKEGTIAEVCSKGYRLHERLIRPALVKVYGKTKTEEKEDPEKAKEA